MWLYEWKETTNLAFKASRVLGNKHRETKGAPPLPFNIMVWQVRKKGETLEGKSKSWAGSRQY